MIPSANTTEAIDKLVSTWATTNDIFFLLVLMAIPVAVTVVMFMARQIMLGFPAAMFWAIFGGYCYTQSTATWDMYYLLFFASSFGMTIFCILAMFGLRHRDIQEKTADETAVYIDEEEKKSGETIEVKGEVEDENGFTLKVTPSERARKLHERAQKRRTGVTEGRK